MLEVWALVEIAGEKILRSSAEALSEAVRQARQVKGRATALVLGPRVTERTVQELRSFGSDRLVLLEHEALAGDTTESFALSIEGILRQERPDLFLFGSSVVGREVAPRLASRLRLSLVTEATYLHAHGDRFVVTRPAYRPHASMLAAAQARGPQMVILASKVMDIEKPGPSPSCSPDRLSGPFSFRSSPIRVLERVQEIPSQVDLTDAEIIVAGGKGMMSGENFRFLAELAELLGGTVGASRMAVDARWSPRESMVGVTGKLVSPELYIACGISGAVQHVMGMRSAQTIVAINTDPTAPIFRISTLGIVGDVREVLPAMIESFKQAKTRAASRELLQ
ncbi:MAG: electron transfer flavoprotein subunit alpha/FixB family protein [bacterium]